MERPVRCFLKWEKIHFICQGVNVWRTVSSSTNAEALSSNPVFGKFKIAEIVARGYRCSCFLGSNQIIACQKRNVPCHISNFGCVPLRWCGSGSEIQDHSDRGRTNESMNRSLSRVDSSTQTFQTKFQTIKRVLLKSESVAWISAVPSSRILPSMRSCPLPLSQ